MSKKQRREIIELFCKYEGLRQKYGRNCTQSELARSWGIGKMSISRWYNGICGIPEARLAWAFRRYRKLADFEGNFIKSWLEDYPPSRLKELLYD